MPSIHFVNLTGKGDVGSVASYNLAKSEIRFRHTGSNGSSKLDQGNVDVSYKKETLTGHEWKPIGWMLGGKAGKWEFRPMFPRYPQDDMPLTIEIMKAWAKHCEDEGIACA